MSGKLNAKRMPPRKMELWRCSAHQGGKESIIKAQSTLSKHIIGGREHVQTVGSDLQNTILFGFETNFVVDGRVGSHHFVDGDMVLCQLGSCRVPPNQVQLLEHLLHCGDGSTNEIKRNKRVGERRVRGRGKGGYGEAEVPRRDEVESNVRIKKESERAKEGTAQSLWKWLRRTANPEKATRCNVHCSALSLR